MAGYVVHATRLARFVVLIGGMLITAQAGGQSSSTPDAAPTQKATTRSKLTVSSNQPWTDAQVDVHLGDVVQIRARSGKGDCSPDGNNNGSKQSLPVSTALAGALI